MGFPICSGFLLACAIYYHLLQENSPIAVDIKGYIYIYIDNLISGASSTEAVSYYRKIKFFNDAE